MGNSYSDSNNTTITYFWALIPLLVPLDSNNAIGLFGPTK